jgi:two-component system cell cycle sensor histidine kinase/response regulator CckA
MKKSEVVTPRPAFRILLVDDNRNGLLVRKSILEELGFTVTALSSPEDAITAFQSSTFDLVITDYQMPNLKGTDVIRIVRELQPAFPIILISGMVDALGLNEKNTGADYVISKSSTEISHLVRSVNRLLRTGAPRKAVSSQHGKYAAKPAIR